MRANVRERLRVVRLLEDGLEVVHESRNCVERTAGARRLLAAMPRLDSPLPERPVTDDAGDAMQPEVLVRVEDVAKHYRRGGALLGRRT